MPHTSIALLRGINVGGKNRLPMKELVRELEALGLEDVRTYVQSGNVVFETARKPPRKLAGEIAEAIERSHGFAPDVLVLTADDLEAAVEGNPFPKATKEPKSLHAFFLAATPRRPDLAKLEDAKSKSERFELAGRVFYLHAPDGIGRSRLAARVEACLGVPTTARNWRTVLALAEMARRA